VIPFAMKRDYTCRPRSVGCGPDGLNGAKARRCVGSSPEIVIRGGNHSSTQDAEFQVTPGVVGNLEVEIPRQIRPACTGSVPTSWACAD
jgi:hypothetical protein